MSIPGSALTFLGAASGAGDAGFKIERSLRFNDDDSAYLSRTFSAGNRQSWTWSGWVKRSELGSGRRALFGAYGASNDTDLLEFGFQAGGIYATTNSTTFLTAEVFRDPSAWYHYFVRYNGSNIKFFINGNEVYSWAKTGDLGINGAWEHNVGRGPATGGRYHDGYLAEVHFVDGQALAVTDFGEFDATTGVWNPIEFTGSHNPAATNYDSLLTVPGGFASGEGAANAFDGSTSTRAKASTADDIFTFDLSSLNLTGSFEFWATNASSEYSLDGGTTWTSSLSSQYTTATSDISGVSNIKFKPSSGTTMKVTAFRNQGNVLVNTPAGVNGFYLNFSDNSTDDALGTDSSGNNNTWDDNNLSADGPSVATTGNISLSNNVNRNFFFKGSVGDTFSCTLGNHVWDSPDGTTWTYRGTSQTSVTLTQIYVVITGSTDISFTNSSSASVKYWDLALSTGIANGAPSGGVGGTTTFNVEAHGAENIDSLLDSPTNYDDGVNVGGNYATLNSISPVGRDCTFSNGNLDVVIADGFGSTNNDGIRAISTIGMTSGKWYFEHKITGGTTARSNVGVVNDIANYGYGDNHWIGRGPGDYIVWSHNGQAYNQTTGTNYGPTWTTGDVIGCAFDADDGKMYIYKNGTVMNSGTPSHTGLTNGPYYFVCAERESNISANFGQRPFIYPPGGTGGPPATYKALCTQNLTDPTIKDGSTAMDVVTDTGSSSGGTFDIPKFTPDLIFSKNRDNSTNHILQDAVRGYGDNKSLYSNLQNNESGTNNIMSVSGKTVTYGTNNNFTGGMVSWAWDAGANSSKTYKVTVVSDSGNKYRFDGHGTSAVTLDLEEGSTYVFDQSDSSNGTGGGHPLRFATQADAANNSEYTTGVTVTGTPGQAGAKTTITVASGAPTLYYYCSSHNGMGGQINTNSTAGATVLSGSLNSSLYNQSQTWSSSTFFNANGNNFGNGQNGAITQLFDNVETGPGSSGDYPIPADGGTFTLTFTQFSSAQTVELKLEGTGNALKINGSFVTIPSGSPATATYSVNGLTTIEWLWNGGSNYCYLGSIKVDGVKLIDSGVSVTNIPSLTSTVRANPAAGFSIVSYTGNGHSQAVGSSTATLGHGLNAQPEFIIAKNRDDSNGQDWSVYHVGADATAPENYYLALNKIDVRNANSSSDKWSNIAPTSSVFTLGSSASVNRGNDKHIAYCFAPIEGYSAFGSYTATATTDGPFVFTGFRPKWIMVKHNTGTANTYSSWLIVDTERDTYNVSDAGLFANKTAAEGTRGNGSGSSGTWLDILSNGFKIKYDGTEVNGTSGDTYIYAAFAENPFKYSRAR